MKLGRRGFLRAVESLIAIVMILATFQAFVNWSAPVRTTATTRQTGYDILGAYSDSVSLAIRDFSAFDQFVSYAVPSSFAYKVMGDFFTPISTRGVPGPVTVSVDFPSIIDPEEIFVADLNSEEYPSSVTFNYYRIPFALQNKGAGAVFDAPIYLTAGIPNLDSNMDGTADFPEISSIDLYLDGKRTPFILHNLIDNNNTALVPTILFNATISEGGSKHGYLYFSTGGVSGLGKILPVERTEVEAQASQNIRILTRAIERAPRATITFIEPAGAPKTVFVLSRIGYFSAIPRNRSSSLSYSENAFQFVLNNSGNISVSIDKASGEYSVFDSGGSKIFSARPLESGRSFSVTIPPHLVNATKSVGKETVHWRVNGTAGRIDFFLTLFEKAERNQILVKRTFIPAGAGTYSFAFDSVGFPAPGSISSEWPDGTYSSERKGVVISGGAPLDVAVYSDSLGRIDFNGTHFSYGSTRDVSAFYARTPIVSSTLYVLGNALSASARPRGIFPGDKLSIDSSSIVITTSPTPIRFVHSFSDSGFDVAIANFTIRRRFNQTIAISCDIEGRKIFSNLVVPPFNSVSDYKYLEKQYAIPSTFFLDGDNSIYCQTNQTNITIESVAIKDISLTEEEGVYTIPIIVENYGGADRTFEVSLDFDKFGISPESGRVFVRDPETRTIEMRDFSGNVLSLRIPAPQGGRGTREIAIAGTESIYLDGTLLAEDISYGGAPVYFPVSLGDNPEFSAYADIGEGFSSSNTYWVSPPDNPFYSDKGISPTADATVSQIFTFDTETGRGASVKIMLWRKA